MPLMRVLALWQEYERDVLPADVDPTQRQETRRAFYAGVAALLAELSDNLDPDPEPTEADLLRMGAIAAELEAFALSVKAGEN